MESSKTEEFPAGKKKTNKKGNEQQKESEQGVKCFM